MRGNLYYIIAYKNRNATRRPVAERYYWNQYTFTEPTPCLALFHISFIPDDPVIAKCIPYANEQP